MIYSLVLVATTALVFSASGLASRPAKPPHYDLQMSSQDLERALSRQLLNQSAEFSNQDQQQPLNRLHQQIIEMGRLNLEWLELINSKRENPIVLYKPGELKGIPIETPASYGPTVIENRHSSLVEELPEAMKAILQRGESPTPDLPTENAEDYRQFARQVDGLYGMTLRWEMMKRWLSYLAARRAEDIRGYHFLSKKDNLESYLRTYSAHPEEEQMKIRFWLQTLCYNSAQFSSDQHFRNCRTEAEQSLEQDQAYEFSQRYWSFAQRRYEAFFKIPSHTRNGSTQKLPKGFVSEFRSASPEMQAFLKDNIEDEFQLGEFNLEVKFTSSRFSGVFVEWLPDVTPHVKGLGSDHIVMNSRDLLEDWNTQWTIRHEFGHVLGLPDCYIEFYERDKGVITNYQIDVDDLMCSRSGLMNERIANELEAAY
jgi:hypothetical protein